MNPEQDKFFSAAKNFTGSLQGKPVGLYYLQNEHIRVSITNYGGRLVNLLVPDKTGRLVDILVGYDSFEGFYHSPEAFFGALIGRYANRIAYGKTEIDGLPCSLPVNIGEHILHGGADGFHNKVWDAAQSNEQELILSYVSADGEMGFPGNLSVKVIYTLAGAELKIRFEAFTDKKTVCNLTSHPFFNLNGDGNMLDHLLQIYADKITPVKANLIPDGHLQPVEGTPFDFRTPATIGSRINDTDIQLQYGNGYDHNYVINGEAGTLRLAATVQGDKSGIRMQLFTDEPGMQFYSGNFIITDEQLKGPIKGGPRTAFCLEPQHFPDSPNQPGFPSTLLSPGEIYTSTTVLKFQ